MTAPRFRSWSATHAGTKRKHNEDAYVDRPDLGMWAVADGAGGHQAGEVASGMIAEALEAIPSGLSASELLAEVRLRDRTDARRIARGGGAARTGCDGGLDRGGDAGARRSFRLPMGRQFARLSAARRRAAADHPRPQPGAGTGGRRRDPAGGGEHHPRANVITRAVGAEMDDFVLDKVSDRLVPGDRFLLCSDGLCKTVPEDQLAELLAAPMACRRRNPWSPRHWR